MENTERTIAITAEYEHQEQLETLLHFLCPIATGYRVEEENGTKRAYITVVA